MKKVLLAVICLSLVSGSAFAAFEVGISGGWNLPLEEMGEGADKGGIALEVRAGMKVGPLTVGLLSGYLPVSSYEGEIMGFAVEQSSYLIPILGFGKFSAGPIYGIAGLGIYSYGFSESANGVSDSDSTTEFGFMLGGGYTMGLGPVALDFGLRYHMVLGSGDSLKNLTALVGVNFGF